jgi:hypothetical protein
MHFQVLLLYLWDNWKPSPAEKWHWECMIMPDCKFVEEFSRAFPSCSLNRCSYIGANYKWNSSSLFFHIRKWQYIGEWQWSDALHIIGQIYWNLDQIPTLFSGENTERLSQHLYTKTSWPWFQKPRFNPHDIDEVSPDCLYICKIFQKQCDTYKANQWIRFSAVDRKFRI